jgi:hypothetical protein
MSDIAGNRALQRESENIEVLREKRRLSADSKNAQFLRRAFATALALTYTCILLQGFGVFGFHLTDSFLNWLGCATVGELGGLLAMVLRQK